MKSVLRNVAINAFALFFLTQVFTGIRISGGIQMFLFSGFVLSIMTFFLKPLLGIITLPLNILTFGIFSFLVNTIILYLLTVFISQIAIRPFVFEGFTAWGFVVPKIYFSLFFAYVVASIGLSVITSFLQWLIKK